VYRAGQKRRSPGLAERTLNGFGQKETGKGVRRKGKAPGRRKKRPVETLWGCREGGGEGGPSLTAGKKQGKKEKNEVRRKRKGNVSQTFPEKGVLLRREKKEVLRKGFSRMQERQIGRERTPSAVKG